MPRTRKPGFRAAHGALRKQGKLTTSETAVMDELITAKAPAPAGPDRTALGRFTAGNTVARRARHRADSDGALAKLEAKADPSWRAAHAWGRRYNRKRFSELAALHGALSAGVGAMLTTAANTLDRSSAQTVQPESKARDRSLLGSALAGRASCWPWAEP